MSDLTETPLKSHELIKGKLLHVFRDEVRLPNGKTSTREWIKHPGAAAVVPLFDDGTTVLIRQYRYAPRQALLEVPAGKIDFPGENPEDVARRELEEETGWKAAQLTSLGAMYPCIGYSNEVIHIFLAEGLTQGDQALCHDEFVEVIPIDFAEAISLARQGILQDAKTVVALLWAEAYLQSS